MMIEINRHSFVQSNIFITMDLNNSPRHRMNAGGLVFIGIF